MQMDVLVLVSWRQGILELEVIILKRIFAQKFEVTESYWGILSVKTITQLIQTGVAILVLLKLGGSALLQLLVILVFEIKLKKRQKLKKIQKRLQQLQLHKQSSQVP